MERLLFDTTTEVIPYMDVSYCLQVIDLSFYDVLLDFVLLDAFDDLATPPYSVATAVQNRWLSARIKETVSDSLLMPFVFQCLISCLFISLCEICVIRVECYEVMFQEKLCHHDKWIMSVTSVFYSGNSHFGCRCPHI